MKSPKNFKAFKDIEAVIESNKGKKESKENSIFALVIYAKPKGIPQVKVLINGFDLKVLDVIIRQVYGKIYAMRRKDDPKAQKMEHDLLEKKGQL